jgi:hypothetical protein
MPGGGGGGMYCGEPCDSRRDEQPANASAVTPTVRNFNEFFMAAAFQETFSPSNPILAKESTPLCRGRRRRGGISRVYAMM